MDKENKDYKSIVQGYVVKNSRKRKNINNLITVILFSCVVIAIIPLVSILIDVFRNGAGAFNLDFLILPPGAMGSGVVEELDLPFREPLCLWDLLH